MGVCLGFYRLSQVAVDFLALVVFQHSGQRFHLRFDDRTVAQTCFHPPNEPPHGLHRRIPHLAVGQIFLLIQKLIPEMILKTIQSIAPAIRVLLPDFMTNLPVMVLAVIFQTRIREDFSMEAILVPHRIMLPLEMTDL